MSSIDSKWEGRTLGGRYQIETLLGRGGMSSVYRAHDPNLQRKVAIKVIHPHLTDNPEFVKRFEQEAAAVAQLRHNNIVRVFDFSIENNTYYMVLEFVAGESLGQKLRQLNNMGMHLPLNDTIHILSKVCDAADYAHQRRMIHRDLKPANVMINPLGEPILMDFGIAKILGGQSHTSTGAAMGTAAYMSPEQVRGEKSDHRADIYSLGIMLFELLRGETPYQGDSTFQIMLKHVNEPIPDIRSLDANIPNAVATILERALEKNPLDRFQSAAEMSTALETVSHQLQGSITDTLAARHVDRLSTMWQQANDFFELRKFPESIDKLDELKQADPDFQQQKVNELRQLALDQLHERAIRLYKENKFEEALRTIQRYQRRAPDDSEAIHLESLIKHGMQNQDTLHKLQSLYDDAALLLEGRKYEEAIQKWESIVLQKGELPFEDKLEIKKRAQEGICSSYYNEALRAVADGEPEKASLLLGQIKHLKPDFPDSQNVQATINQLIVSRNRRTVLWRTGGVVLLMTILLFLAYTILQRFNDENQFGNPALATAQPTATQEAIVVVNPTATSATEILEPIETQTATAVPTFTATATSPPTLSPTSTATATATLLPAETATPLNADTAVVILPASIFAAPSSTASEEAILQVDEVIVVLGRSEIGNWLYVMNQDGDSGFVFGERVSWGGNFEELPIFFPQEAIVTPNSTITGLEFDLFPIAGSSRCENNMWFTTLLLDARGGNGVYDYFWAGNLVASQQAGPITLEISSLGAPIIEQGQVISADGQSINRELFITPPDCFSG